MTGKILVVDPVATNRIILKAKLSAHFYDAESVAEADLALAVAAQTAPDVILLADSLPGAGSAALCAALRQAPQTADTPIVVLSQTGGGARCLMAGADDVLPREGVSRDRGDAILFARMRSLMRDASLRRDLSTRLDGAARMQAMAIDWTGPARGAIGWVSAERSVALGQIAQLGRPAAGTITLLDPATLPGRAPVRPAPDLFVLDQDLGRHGSGLDMLSDLRTRDHSRAAATLLLMPHWAETAAAFDLGASGVCIGPADRQDLAARLTAILRRKHQRDRLRHAVDTELEQASCDALTGLQTRRAAMAKLAELAASGVQAALAMIDIDHFKSVNDRFGHAAGDSVLAAVADRLKAAFDGPAIVGRLGGEEFLVAMCGPTAAMAAQTDAARHALAQAPFHVPGAPNPIRVTISAGVAALAPGQAPQASLAQADAALYRAKGSGRNRVRVAAGLSARAEPSDMPR